MRNRTERRGRRWKPWGALAATVVGAFVVGFAAMSAWPLAQAAWPRAAGTAIGACERYSGLPADAGRTSGMVRLPAGRFRMGDDERYPEEGVAHDVTLDGFWIDRHDVTNAQFARFVAATGHVTVAEREPDPQLAAELPEFMRVSGSVVFEMPQGGKAGRWRYAAGANWRQPEGPGSSIDGRENHPVVHVAFEDALAYAKWLGRELPTEAQWEYAARGGLAAQPFVWGERFAPDGRQMANTWQGPFPLANTRDDGFLGTSPVGCFDANGYGLYDMAGNVWQWTTSWFRPEHLGDATHNPTGPEEALALDPRQPDVPAKVIKGGSFLCAPNYCMRYRPAARQAREPSSGTAHIGFRTIINELAPANTGG